MRMGEPGGGEKRPTRPPPAGRKGEEVRFDAGTGLLGTTFDRAFALGERCVATARVGLLDVLFLPVLIGALFIHSAVRVGDRVVGEGLTRVTAVRFLAADFERDPGEPTRGLPRADAGELARSTRMGCTGQAPLRCISRGAKQVFRCQG